MFSPTLVKLPKFSYLLAAPLLVVISWIAIHQSETRHPVSADLDHATRYETLPARSAPSGTPEVEAKETTSSLMGENRTGKTRAIAAMDKASPNILSDRPSSFGTSSHGPASDRHVGERRTAGFAAPANEQTNPNRGVQLAQSVKLPAAVMALADPGFKNLTPQQNAALQNVIDTFYRELAVKAEEGLSSGQLTNGQLVLSPEGEETVVIQPGPDVDKARDRANEIFRALFGDDRYNQVTMQSAMENMLPPAQEEMH